MSFHDVSLLCLSAKSPHCVPLLSTLSLHIQAVSVLCPSFSNYVSVFMPLSHFQYVKYLACLTSGDSDFYNISPYYTVIFLTCWTPIFITTENMVTIVREGYSHVSRQRARAFFFYLDSPFFPYRLTFFAVSSHLFCFHSISLLSFLTPWRSAANAYTENMVNHWVYF